MARNLILLLFLYASVGPAHGETGTGLSPLLARKISIHLLGRPISTQEWVTLQNSSNLQTPADFAQALMKNPDTNQDYYRRMSMRILEHVQLPYEWTTTTRLQGRTSVVLPANSAYRLIRRTVETDQSWDDLLIASDFARENPSTTRFLMQQKISVEPKINRAGLLSTPEFLERFTSTASNRNYKRAAQIYRTFLCDPMQAVIVSDSEMDRKLLAMANVGLVTGRPERDQLGDFSSSSNRHASDPACQKCHRKLDPVAQLYEASTLELSPIANSGALVIDSVDGPVFRREVVGLRDFAQVLIQQPQYVECQVRQFWKWFVGQDVNLNHDRLDQVIAAFNASGRKPGKYIQWLVSQPEFDPEFEVPREHQIYTQGSYVLSRCNTCHENPSLKPKVPIPNFSKFPIGGSERSHKIWLSKIAASLDLANGGRAATMPPQDQAEPLGREDLRALNQWLRVGAVTPSGSFGVTASDFANLVAHEEVAPHRVTFEPNHRRMLSGLDLTISVQDVLKANQLPHSADCKTQVGQINRQSTPLEFVRHEPLYYGLGGVSPISNTRSTNESSSALVNYILNCWTNPIIVLTSNLINQYKQSRQAFGIGHIWKNLSQEVQEDLLNEVLIQLWHQPLVMTPAIQDLKRQIRLHLNKPQDSILTIEEALHTAFVRLLLSDSFLVY